MNVMEPSELVACGFRANAVPGPAASVCPEAEPEQDRAARVGEPDLASFGARERGELDRTLPAVRRAELVDVAVGVPEIGAERAAVRDVEVAPLLPDGLE